jgi:hypothetical protein
MPSLKENGCSSKTEPLGDARTISDMLAIALTSADQTARDLKRAHSKRCLGSPTSGAGPRVHSEANRLDRSAKK